MYPEHYHYAWLRWLKRNNQRYSRNKYRRKSYHKKKDPTPNHITDWRDRKGFQKDQSKGKIFCKSGRYYKDQDHRSRRAWERTMIDSEKWDNLGPQEYLYYTSSWDWC